MGLTVQTAATPGLHVEPGFLTGEDFAVLSRLVAGLDSRAEALLARGARLDDALIVVPEAESPDQVCRYEGVLAASPAMTDFCRRHLQPLAERVAGAALTPFKDKVNRKAPGGGAFRPHQDIAAYRHFPQTRFLTAAVALDPMTPANGALSYAGDFMAVAASRPDLVLETLPGGPLFTYAQGGPLNGDLTDDVSGTLAWTEYPLPAGGLILFDAFIPHRSPPNTTDQPRRTLFVTYGLASEGDGYGPYYARKRSDPGNPIFHVSTPTLAAG